MVAALEDQGFSDIGVEEDGGVLVIRAQNDRYFYSMRALGILFKSISPFLTNSMDQVRVVLTDAGVPVVEFVTSRADIQDLTGERLTAGEFFYLSRLSTDVANAPAIRTTKKRPVSLGWKPSFQTLLNDPSGYFKYRFGAEGWAAYHPWKGVSLLASLEAYPLNNISSSNIPPAEAVRSDIVEYKRQNIALGRLMIDQIYKGDNSIYSRFAAGFLEIEYAGLDTEVAMPVVNGRFMVGLQASLVKKRDRHNPLAFEGADARPYYHVEFLNTRLNIPEKDIAIDLKTGRFLGRDFGTKVTMTKHVKGVNFFAWYSLTDTSGFKDTFNRGYHDTGIGVSIPMRLFEGKDSKTSYNFALAPWTRDVAQDIDRYRNLFDYVGRDTKVYLLKDKGMIE
jgi:hypothetical protein